MDNMEGDGELPRCGGCGRTFERRAALAAHTHTCQPRSRALARRPPAHESKKIEIQIRKDYNKGPASLNLMPKADIGELGFLGRRAREAMGLFSDKHRELARHADKRGLQEASSLNLVPKSDINEFILLGLRVRGVMGWDSL